MTKPAPVRDQLLELIRQHGPDGMTTVELAVRMGKSSESVNSALCKMRMYGLVQKEAYRPVVVKRMYELTKWKLPC